MKKMILTWVYSLVGFVPISLLIMHFEIDSWWVIVVAGMFSYLFIGNFIYARRHGVQVWDLKQLEWPGFVAIILVGGKGRFKVVGSCYSTERFSDLGLQSLLIRTLSNSMAIKQLREFIEDTSMESVSFMPKSNILITLQIEDRIQVLRAKV